MVDEPRMRSGPGDPPEADGVASGRDPILMSLIGLTLRAARPCRFAPLPARVVVFAEIVLRFAHDMRFSLVVKMRFENPAVASHPLRRAQQCLGR